MGATIEAALSFHSAGRFEEARRLYRQMITLAPDRPECLYFLGEIALGCGQCATAVIFFTRATRSQPTAFLSHAGRGHALAGMRHYDGALAAFVAGIIVAPNSADLFVNRGTILSWLGRWALAIISYRRALCSAPDRAETHSNLGNARTQMGQHEEAIAACRRAIALAPALAEAHSNLGNALQGGDHFAAAADAYRRALCLRPNFAECRSNLGNALKRDGRLPQAAAAYRTAIAIAPDLGDAWSNLAHGLIDLGRHDQAIAVAERAILIQPDNAAAHSNLQMWYQYRAAGDGKALAALRRFATRFETAPLSAPAAMPARHERRLRVGYVSGDFYRHPVGRFLLPVLRGHDRDAFEIVCYANQSDDDEVTAALRGHTDRWRNIAGLTDPEAAALILGDSIDLLVDLSGHTARNRLPLFALRPAARQVSWLGYWASTGLSRIDYVLSDAVTIGPGDEEFYSEKIIRLPFNRFCYEAPPYAPPPSESPLRGVITFGSFNNIAKLGPAVIALWSALLRAVPQSRLVLKWHHLDRESNHGRLIDAFASHGIDAGRLDFRGRSLHAAMLAEYGDIDIALDPFPFSGGLTSCEALWMGIPVVTLPGSQPQSRQTASFLHCVGLGEWVAGTEADFIARAARLAADPSGRAHWRQALRRRMAESPLCDTAGFTDRLEAVFRAITLPNLT